MLSAHLNKIITIQQSDPSVNSVGSPISVWSDYLTTYAGVYTPTGDTKFTQEGQQFTYRTEFKIRYNDKTKVINNKYRIKYNDTYYKIVQTAEIELKSEIKLITIAFDDGD